MMKLLLPLLILLLSLTHTLANVTVKYQQRLEHQYRMAVKTVLAPPISFTDRILQSRSIPPITEKSTLSKRSIISAFSNLLDQLEREKYFLPSVLTNFSFDKVFTELPAPMVASMAESSIPDFNAVGPISSLKSAKSLPPPKIAVQSVDSIAWMNAPGNSSAIVGQVFSLSRDIWVTRHPDVKRFCRRKKPNRLRLAQYLGLPPTESLLLNRKFIRISAPINHIFRPCLRNHTNPHTCAVTTVSFETRTRPPLVRYGTDGRPIRLKESKWFYSLAVESPIYQYWQTDVNQIFPWTRLGFTFDWHRWGRGAEEYVIPKDTKVLVNSVETFDEFCIY